MRHGDLTDIAVIGAGTTGSSIAYHLAARGEAPLLLDRHGPAGGPSGASAGMLRQHYDDPAIIELARAGCAFLVELESRIGYPSGFTGCGYVVVGSEEQAPGIRATYEAMRAQGVDAELLDLAGLRAIEPRLRADDLAIGCFEPGMGYCDPLFVASGFAAAAARDGARCRFGTEVRSIAVESTGFRLELGDGTTILAETCVVAAGAWSNALTAGLGGAVPLTLRRGQIGRYRPPHAFGGPGPIISDHVHELWMRPDGADGHYLVGGRGGRADDELAAPELAIRGADGERLAEFERELGWRMPAARGGIWRGSWSSFYDFTPDGNPVADRVPGHDRLFVATGGSGHAFKLAPVLGLGIAELVCDGAVSSHDWSSLRFGRFA